MESMLSDTRLLSAGLCDTDTLSKVIKNHAKVIDFDAGQIMQIEGDDSHGLMIIVKGRARSYVRSEIVERMEKSLSLAGFLRKLKQDLRLSNSVTLLWKSGIDAVKKRLVNYKCQRKQAGEELTQAQYEELAKKVLQTSQDCLAYHHPSSKALEAQKFLRRSGSLREFTQYEEFLTRRLFLKIPWTSIGSHHLATHSRGDVLGIGEHFHSTAFTTVVAENHTRVIWIDSLTVDRYMTKTLADRLFDSISAISNLMPNSKSWLKFAEKFVVIAINDVKRLNSLLDSSSLYFVVEGEVTVRSRGEQSIADRQKAIEADTDDHSDVAMLKSPVLRCRNESTMINRQAPIVDVLTKSEMVLISKDMKNASATVTSSSAVFLSATWKICELLANNWMLQKAMKNIVKEKLARYESKADMREAKVMKLDQSMSVQIKPIFTKTLKQLNALDEDSITSPSSPILPKHITSPSPHRSPIPMSTRFDLSASPLPISTMKTMMSVSMPTIANEIDALDVKPKVVVADMLRGDPQTANVWSKGNSRERIANMKTFVGLFGRKGESNGKDHLQYREEDLRREVSDNLQLLSGMYLAGRKKIRYNKSIGNRNPYGVTQASIVFDPKVLNKSTTKIGNKSTLSSDKRSTAKGIDGSSVAWPSRKQKKEKSYLSPFMIKGSNLNQIRPVSSQPSQAILKTRKNISDEVSIQLISKDFLSFTEKDLPGGSKKFLDLSNSYAQLGRSLRVTSAKPLHEKPAHFTSFDYLQPEIRSELEKFENKAADFRTVFNRKFSGHGGRRVFLSPKATLD